MKFVVLAAFLLSLSVHATEVKEFRIAKGTANQRWNTQAEQVEMKVGETLRIFNDDVVDHQLHTNGAPCAHGDLIKPGKYWDCVASKPFDAGKTGPLYDHGVGKSAEFWLRASP